jgi:hypothetical protein
MMNGVSKLEFLCDAIAEYTGSHDPRSRAYKLRNPIALKEPIVVRNGEGKAVELRFGDLRQFKSLVHGYEAALFDLKMKCSGRGLSGLSKFSTIADLTEFYGMQPGSAGNVADYLSFALEDEGITKDSQLFIFLK